MLLSTIFLSMIFKVYFISFVVSFCLGMMGYSYLKTSGALPDGFSVWIPAFIWSLIPVINMIWALLTLFVGIEVNRDPEQHKVVKRMFFNIKEQQDNYKKIRESVHYDAQFSSKNKQLDSTLYENLSKEDLIKKILELEDRILELKENENL
jgi:hypothetical protein